MRGAVHGPAKTRPFHSFVASRICSTFRHGLRAPVTAPARLRPQKEDSGVGREGSGLLVIHQPLQHPAAGGAAHLRRVSHDDAPLGARQHRRANARDLQEHQSPFYSGSSAGKKRYDECHQISRVLFTL